MTRKHRVLLIEDEATTSKLLSLCLPCFEMVIVATVRDALRQLFNHAKQPFSAIIVDLRLPDGQGPEVVTKVRQNISAVWPGLDVPIIVVTGMSEADAPSVVVHRSGADAMLRKPVDPEALRTALIDSISVRVADEKFASMENFMEQAISDSRLGMVPNAKSPVDSTPHYKRKSDPPIGRKA